MNTRENNTGYYNSGDCNSGDYNSGYCNSGWFNTNEPKMRIFNKTMNIDFREKFIKTYNKKPT